MATTGSRGRNVNRNVNINTNRNVNKNVNRGVRRDEQVIWEKNSPYIYEKFAMELQDFTKTGELPLHGDQDIRYCLELQQERLNNHGLNMEYEFQPRGLFADGGGYGKGWKDIRYNSKMEYRTCKATKIFHRNGKRIYKKAQDSIFYQITTDINNGEMIGQDLYTCPSCGAINKFCDMQNGCPSCGTFFEMSDLYPKVTNFFFIEDSGNTVEEAKHSVGKIVVPCMLISIIAYMVYFLLNPEVGNGIIGSIISGILAGVLFGGIVGYLLWAFMKVGRITGNAGKSLSMVTNVAGSESRYVASMRQISPEFSYEYFSDKVVSLLKMIIFAEDASQLPNYVGQPIGSAFYNIVDVSYTGAVALKQFQVQNGFCNVAVDVYMDVIYDNGGKLSTRRNIFSMNLSKNVTKPIDFYFSVKKIQCKNCGGSFDATKQRSCPNCGSWYDVGDDDWLVVGVQKK